MTTQHFTCPACGGSECNHGARTGTIYCGNCSWSGPASACGLAPPAQHAVDNAAETILDKVTQALAKITQDWKAAHPIGEIMERHLNGVVAVKVRVALLKELEEYARTAMGMSPPAPPASERKTETLTTLTGQPAGTWWLCQVWNDSKITAGYWDGQNLSRDTSGHMRLNKDNYRDFTRLYDAAEVAAKERTLKHFLTNAVHAHHVDTERLTAELATVEAEREELRSTVESVNVLAREYGFGQGQIDDDLVGCLRSIANRQLATPSESSEIRKAVDALLRSSPPDAVHGGQYANMDEMAEDAIRIAADWLRLHKQIADIKAVLRDVPIAIFDSDAAPHWLERRHAVLNEPATQPPTGKETM